MFFIPIKIQPDGESISFFHDFPIIYKIYLFIMIKNNFDNFLTKCVHIIFSNYDTKLNKDKFWGPLKMKLTLLQNKIYLILFDMTL